MADGIIVDQGGPGQQPQQQAVAVPTMTEWGMIIFMILAGLGSVYYLRRGIGVGEGISPLSI